MIRWYPSSTTTRTYNFLRFSFLIQICNYCEVKQIAFNNYYHKKARKVKGVVAVNDVILKNSYIVCSIKRADEVLVKVISFDNILDLIGIVKTLR